MQMIILGCGRVGSTLAKIMAAEGHDVTIIDQTSDAFRRLGTKFRGKRLVGSGTDADVLRRAGIEEADVFVSVTDGDNRNIMAAQLARTVFGVPRVLTRLYDPIRAQAYGEMGIHTICTTTIAAGLMRDLALERPAEDLVEILNAAYAGPTGEAGKNGAGGP
jgi:trk/ktr system potassium uptake protein